MAMYYQGSSEIPADGFQTHYLMNPNNYVGFSDNQQQPATNMLFFNDNSSTAAAVPVLHEPLPRVQQFMGIPISYEYPSRSSVLGQEEQIHDPCHNAIPRFHHNFWRSVDESAAGNQPNMPQQTSKSLSLSLSPHQASFISNKSVHGYQDFPGQSSIEMISPKNSSNPSVLSAVPNGINTVGLKYLEAAKQLLDEVASVGMGMENDRLEGSKDKGKKIKESMALNAKASSGGGENGDKGRGAELTIAQRQEIQMKKAKLLSMLDEVEQRYRQYHHQMKIVVASLEQAAGVGSAKSYTNLAIKTILKQFLYLRDAIFAQIKDLNNTLGEEHILGGKSDGSRIKFIDHQLRQEKTLQQLGMMQNSIAWRPHKGLPERAISVLRAWLFEHFLHPYPKDSDKRMLAKQTGLTRSQVSNWFVNARVRLWKPMVEEMYLEEIKNQDQANNSDENYTNMNGLIKKELGSKSTSKQEKNTGKMDRVNSFQSKTVLNLQVSSPTEISASTVITTSPTAARPGFSQLMITSPNMENIAEKNPKKPRNYPNTQDNSPNSILSNEMEMKDTVKGFMDNKFNSDREQNYGCNGFGYGIGELGRFNTEQWATGPIHGNNTVSLTLALPPSQSSPLSARNHQQNFLSNTNFEFGTRIETGVNHSSRVNGIQDSNIGYGILDFQNRKTFPAQLLPDFVA